VDRQPDRAARGKEPTQLAFHASRIIINLGVLIALGSMSLAFVESPAGDRSSMEADALPALLLLIPIFLITLIPDHTRPIPNPLGWLALVLGTAAFPYAVVKFLDATTLAETLEGTVGLGARLLVFGTFVTVLGIAVGLARNMLRLPTGGTYPASRRRPRLRAPTTPPRSNAVTESGAGPEPAPRQAAAPEGAADPVTSPGSSTDTRTTPSGEAAPRAERVPRSGRAAAERARRADAERAAPHRTEPDATEPRGGAQPASEHTPRED
jgi:hypothetical protein